MKKIIDLLILVMFISGCAAYNTNYYTDPNSSGYAEQALGGLCERCNRVFNFSGQQLNTIENIQCPYCGQVQNLRMASNRYIYLKQQQEAQSYQQALSKIQDIQVRHDEAQQRNIQQFQQNIADWNAEWRRKHNQVGTRWNPVHVTVDND